MNKKAAGEGVDVPTRDRICSTLAALPYARHLGIRVAEVDGAGTVVFHLPFEARLIGNVTLPAYHGGIVATFMQVAALTATYVLHDEDRPPKLVDFSIDYLSSAGPLDLFARCEMHRVGKRVAAVGIRCWQQDPDAPVALGRAHVFVASSASDSMVF